MAKVKTRLGVLAALVAAMWLVELADLVIFGGALDLLGGIRPRSQAGLWGIVFAPFLHGGFAHLVANTVPLVVLGLLIMLRGLRDFVWATVIAAVLAGLGVWLFGRPQSVHIGASGLIFGYLGYLLLRGYWERSLTAILVALVAGFLYGGALWGVLPTRSGISWEGHLFGFAGGATAAAIHRRPPSTAGPDRSPVGK